MHSCRNLKAFYFTQVRKRKYTIKEVAERSKRLHDSRKRAERDRAEQDMTYIGLLV